MNILRKLKTAAKMSNGAYYLRHLGLDQRAVDAPTVRVIFTNGVGNQIFQYVFSRLLANDLGIELSHDSLPALSVKKNNILPSRSHRTMYVSGQQNIEMYRKILFEGRSANIVFLGYPEDYKIYTSRIAEIRSWFQIPSIQNREDLVLHLRLGDRLYSPNTLDPRFVVKADRFRDAIERFEFKKLHIVTDLPFWGYFTVSDLKRMKTHKAKPLSQKVAYQDSVDYVNALIEELSSYQPTIRTGFSVEEDFSYMCKFDQILFQHGTLAWWAAALSGARAVSPYGPWRPFKGALNRNLGYTDLPGWFPWS